MSENVVILAAGQGKRMKSPQPKVLCRVLEKPMIEWVSDACLEAGLDNICVVKGFAAEILDEYLGGRFKTVTQSEQLGTGHAVMQAEDFLKENIDGNTLVLYGDAPFIDSKTIADSLDFHKSMQNQVTVITAELSDPTGYGRIIKDGDRLVGNVEQKDATPEQLLIKEVNSGCYWFKTSSLIDALQKITPENAQGEYYLPDCIGVIVNGGGEAGAFKSTNPDIVLGANDRKALLNLNNIARMKVIDKHLENGVEFTCTDGVIITPEVEIGVGTVIRQGVILRGRTKIGAFCDIGPNSLLENTSVGNETTLNNVQAYNAEIGNNVKMGPFVHIRPDSVIKDGVKIGDFVEVKNSIVGEKTSVSHLTYIGDSDVGANVNFGCGVVTVNYDGENKFRTEIGDNAFIGCNTNLVSPVKIGNEAYTAAGSTITGNVPDGALAIERGKTVIKDGYAYKKLKKRTEKFEKEKAKAKASKKK